MFVFVGYKSAYINYLFIVIIIMESDSLMYPIHASGSRVHLETDVQEYLILNGIPMCHQGYWRYSTGNTAILCLFFGSYSSMLSIF